MHGAENKMKSEQQSDDQLTRMVKVPTYLKILVGTSLGALIAVSVIGLVFLLIDPAEGSTTEAVMGISAAFIGLACIPLFSVSFALLFRWRSWSLMPSWVRVYTAAVGVFVIVGFAFGLLRVEFG